MKKFTFIISSLLLSTVTMTGTTLAGDAVSELNGKIELTGGNVNGSASETISGSISAPISNNFGAQFDILTGDVGTSQQHGSSAHLFWRDSDKGLVGLVAAHLEVSDTEINLGGVEAEYYMNQITFSGAFAEQTGDASNGYYSKLMLTYYAISNLAISASFSQHDNLDRQELEIEYLIPNTSISIIANASDGQSDYDHARIGVRYYFGTQKELIRRHREDDPRSPLGDMIPSIEDNSDDTNGNGGGRIPLPCVTFVDSIDGNTTNITSNIITCFN